MKKYKSLILLLDQEWGHFDVDDPEEGANDQSSIAVTNIIIIFVFCKLRDSVILKVCDFGAQCDFMKS